MALFTLPCRDCGAPVEIYGRFGFKLKNAGVTASICRRCRQQSFQSTAAQSSALVPRNNRLIPVAALLVAGLIIGTGSWLIHNNRPQPFNPAEAAG